MQQKTVEKRGVKRWGEKCSKRSVVVLVVFLFCKKITCVKNYVFFISSEKTTDVFNKGGECSASVVGSVTKNPPMKATVTTLTTLLFNKSIGSRERGSVCVDGGVYADCTRAVCSLGKVFRVEV